MVKDDYGIDLKSSSKKIKTFVRSAPMLLTDHHNLAKPDILIFFSINAIELLLTHVYSTTEREVGGVLIGAFCKDEQKTNYYLDICATLKGEHALENKASLTFTHETWNKLHDQVGENYPQASILGWYHTHPGFGVFLSNSDKFIHNNFFNMFYQVSMVIDPLKSIFKIFSLRDSVFVQNNNCFVYVKSDSVENITKLVKLASNRELQASAKKDLAHFYFNEKLRRQQNNRFAVCLDNSMFKAISKEFTRKLNGGM